MIGRTEFWIAVGIIVGGVGGVLAILLTFQTDTSTRLNLLDDHQLSQTQTLGEISGAVGYVQALDRNRVEEVLTAMGVDPNAAPSTQVYLARAGVSDVELMDISSPEAAGLTSIVSTFRVDDKEIRCVSLRDERSAYLCAPTAAEADHQTTAENSGR